MQPLIAVIGPTASGKTALGEFLALELHGEIISADAKQVYRGMDIGTAKEKDLRVPQHLIDIFDPGQAITVAEYQRLAYAAIDDVLARGKQPILVGGSMLYAQAVIDGYTFTPGGKSQESMPRYKTLVLGLEWERTKLKTRATERLHQRIAAGLAQEVQALLNAGVSPAWLDDCGIEYRYFKRYLCGEISYDQAVSQTVIAIHQYIKRQYTWWRHHGEVHWFRDQKEALQAVQVFLHTPSMH